MPHVLVVDDDPTVREVVVSYLRAHGHQVAECDDGAEALRRLTDAPPDLVVLDLMLPGLDGLEVCRRLRALPDAQAEVPVVMLTALTESEDRIAGLEVGADDYVSKPFSPRELALRVDSVLRRARVEVTGQVVGEQVRLRVSDGCGGLAEDDLARVLEVGWQAGGARTPSAQPLTRGGGLGLAIVAGLVEAHGGHVHAENQPAGPGGAVPGCRFVVTLPPC